jgi:N-acetylneuraminic acid mutarotase
MIPPLPAGWARAARPFRLVICLTLALVVAGPVPAARASAATTTPSPAWQARGYQPAACNTGEQAGATDETPMARCYAIGLATKDGQLVQQVAEPPSGALGPPDIQSAYDLPDGGEGQTVAIVDAFGYDAAEADLAVYRAHYGLPPCTSANGCFKKVDQRGGTAYPREDEGWSIETALDLDAVSSACPKCDILLVQADDNSSANLGAAVDTAATLGAVAISNSYGIAGEYRYQTRYDAHYDHPGIAVTVSSGDYGNIQSYPATNPNVVAVGGTRLERDSSARGWKETAWSDAGSGCSLYEPRPEYQVTVDTGCPDNRATADISALADPETGLAVYNTLGQDGWAQWGGTSLASPLVAAMYALAGDPVPGTYPVTYAYRKDKAAHLNDITEGSNGWCGDQLCNARTGWDGPTGVGTPNGVASLTLGDSGQISGTVTGGNTPLAGATVTVTDSTGATFKAVTDASGKYTLAVPVGTYDVVAAKFGYHSKTLPAVSVGAQATVAGSFALTSIPSRGLTGRVTDGSGHGWPVYAQISIDGYPGGPVFTDPFTGRYQVDLPVGAAYTLHVSPVDLPGYRTGTVTATVDPAPKGRPTDVRQDVSLQVDAATCTSPGYATNYHGAGTDFTGWGTAAQGGWRVTDDAGTGKTWRFDDPGLKGNLTGGGGDFAIVDGWYNPGRQDTSLVSPTVDLSAETAPVIGFDTDYSAWGEQTGDLDFSLDNGSTWTTVFQLSNVSVRDHIEIPIPQAAGKTGVQVRFRYQGEVDNWWQLDNVFVGSQSCDPVTGGLVSGYVRDDNNGAPVVGATVTTATAQVATSQATPDDVQLADGYYWLFAPAGKSVPVTVTGRNYADSTANVRVEADQAVRRDWRLAAGQLSVHSGDISVSQGQGRTGYRQVRLTNDGSQPLHVSLVEQDRGYTPAGGKQPTAPGAPLVRLKGETPLGSLAGRGDRPSHTAPTQDATSGTAWTNLPEYPDLVMDNLVADDDGKVYSVGGTGDEAVTANGYTYDPQTKAWKAIADMPEAREAPVGAFVNGKLFVTGGWDLAGTTSTTYAYDPVSNSWSRKADLPIAMAAGAATSVNGKLYVVGGCTTNGCIPASGGTFRYDPGKDTWTKLADYPETVAFLACAPAGDGLVCAGGVDPGKGWNGEPTNTTYRYFPESDTWVKVGYMPYYAFGMAYTGVGGKLQIVGGNSYGTVSNQAWEFDPATGVWSALPNANTAQFRGGAACGLYQVGGSPYSFNPTPLVQKLTGYDYCVHGSDVPWLSANRTEFDVPAGKSVTVTVAVDASAVAGLGQYDARLAVVTDTPYATSPIKVAMSVH